MVKKSDGKIITLIILLALIILCFFIVRSILLSILFGILLAFIFSPVYRWLYRLTKMKNFSVVIICIFLAIVITIPFWFLTPIIINQSIKVYMSVQQADFITPLKQIFPSFFSSQEFSTEIGSIIHSFVARLTNSIMNGFSNLILNLPIIMLQLAIVFFTFYFVLRDGEELVDYIKSLLPFPRHVEEKLIEYTRGITSAVLYGQVVVGLIQGAIIGIGFFIFKVPNALLLTFFSALLGILPVLGTPIIWLPVFVYLTIAGNITAAIGILIFGLIASNVDGVLRPLFVSKMIKIHTGVVLIGMIGGVLFLGILGLILGPLVFSYLLVFLEVYRDKKSSRFFIKPKK